MMNLKNLLNEIEYELIKGDLDISIKDIKFDSRKVEKGDVFVALLGSNVDGHKFIDLAIENGAKAVVVSKDVNVREDIVVIKVTNTRHALALMSSNYFGRPSLELTVVGITGTKGKTTTSFMIKDILEKSNVKTGVIGTTGVFYNDVSYPIDNTTPESYDVNKYMREMLDNDIKCVVMEVSSQALKYNRVDGIDFDYGIFTNLTRDHISEHEHSSMEDYISSKAILFKNCKHGIFNIDDEHYEDMINNCTCDIHTIGYSDKADLHIKEATLVREPGVIGINMTTTGAIDDTFMISTPGIFSSYNAAVAIMCTHVMGVSTNNMKEALKHFAVRGRVEVIPIFDHFTFIIDYAHNGVSMESILTTMRKYNPKRLVTIFGCGGNRSRDRRYEMGEISGKLADFSIITTDNPRFEAPIAIINDILVGINKTDGEYITIVNRKEAIKYAIENAQDGDIILLLGKGHEDYQEIEGVKYPFDERDVIKEVLKEIK